MDANKFARQVSLWEAQGFVSHADRQSDTSDSEPDDPDVLATLPAETPSIDASAATQSELSAHAHRVAIWESLPIGDAEVPSRMYPVERKVCLLLFNDIDSVLAGSGHFMQPRQGYR